MLSSTKYFNKAFVLAGRSMNIPPSQYFFVGCQVNNPEKSKYFIDS